MSSSFQHAREMKEKHIIGTSQKWKLQILFFLTGSQDAFALMMAAVSTFCSAIKKMDIFLDIQPRLLYRFLLSNVVLQISFFINHTNTSERGRYGQQHL
jgi:hypothetical protein